MSEIKNILPRIIFTIMLTAGLSFAAIILSSQPSYADGTCVGDCEIDIDDEGGTDSGLGGDRDPNGGTGDPNNPPGGGSSNGGNNGGGNGGEDGWTPPVTTWYEYRSKIFDFQNPQGDYYYSYNYPFYTYVSGYCSPIFDEVNQPNGAVGGTSYMRRSVTGYYSAGQGDLIYGSWRTYRSPSCFRITSTVETVRCYTDATAVISKTAGDNPRIMERKTVNTRWPGNSSGTYNECLNSDRISIALSSPLSEYGRYTARSTLNYTTIRVRHYSANPLTGEAAYDRIESYDNRVRTSVRNNYAQLTCQGGIVSPNRNTAWHGTGWQWTETDCGPDNTPNPSYQCSAGRVNVDGVRYNGNAVDIFRDNSPHAIEWVNPTITAVGSPYTITSESTLWRHNGTPEVDNITLTVNGNKVNLRNNSGTNFMSGLNLEADLQARWATDRGDELTIQPYYRYGIRWQGTAIEITSINPFTGAAIYNEVPMTINSSAECPGGPVDFNVLRTAVAE